MIRLQIVLNGFKEEYFKKDTLFIEIYRKQWIKKSFYMLYNVQHN